MAKLPGSGIRMASIPLAQTITTFSPETGNNPGPGPGPGPNPGPGPRGGSGGGLGIGLIGLLLLVFGLSAGNLTAPAPPPPEAAVPITTPAGAVIAAGSLQPDDSLYSMRGGRLR